MTTWWSSGAGGEVSAAPAELDADAVAGVGLEDVLHLQLWPGQDLDAAPAIGQEEQVIALVPADLIHLKLELLLRPDLEGLGVDEGEEILLVTHGDGAAVRRPGDVDVLPLAVDRGHGLAGPGVPHPDRLVPRGRGEEVGLGGVPGQLVHTVPVPLEHVLLAQAVRAEAEDADCLVVAPTGQLLPVAAPVDAVHL